MSHDIPDKSRGRKSELFFLSSEEARFFSAISELIIPSGRDPQNHPGAREVGTLNYIDSTLLDFPKPVQDYFRGILGLVNDKSKERFSKNFTDLETTDQDLVLRGLFLDPQTRERTFDLRSIALEGFYSDYHDPWYYGVTPWELVRFGGKRISDLEKDWTFLKVWKEYKKK